MRPHSYSQQVKWNHFIMTSVDDDRLHTCIHGCVYMHVMICVYVVSSRRNKTNPHNWIYRDIPVLSTTHLQAFKPKQASSDQPQWADQHGCYRSSSCISWNIFNRIHFIAICDVWLDATCAFGHVNEHVWSYRKLTKQLRTTLLPNHIEHVHTARQLPEYTQC